MKEVIVLLLVIGFLVGTYAIGELGEYSFQKCTEFSGGEGYEGGLGGPAPCGGGGGGGSGGPPTPG